MIDFERLPQPKFSLGQRVFCQLKKSHRTGWIIGIFYQDDKIAYEVLTEGFSHSISLSDREIQQENQEVAIQ